MTTSPDLWTERDLATHVARVARLGGWLRYHTFDSRRSTHGFPDEVLVHPARGLLLFRELKSEDGAVRPEQTTWLEALVSAGADAGVWRPSDLEAIEKLLVQTRKRGREATRAQRPSTDDQAPTLFDVWACPRCDGAGSLHDPETGRLASCRVCFGTGSVSYDPSDSSIPY